MAVITLGTLRDYWKAVSDWVTGTSNSQPKVVVGGSSAISTGQIVATTLPATLSADQAVSEVAVQADITNTNDVFIGGPTGQTIRLEPGATLTIAITNVNLLYTRTDSGTATVNWIGRG